MPNWNKNRLYILLVLFCLCSGSVYGQFSNKGNSEFFLSDGVLSWDQIHGVLGDESNATGFMDLPERMSGAVFATYRYHFSDAASLGFTLGMDNQAGTLSYGKEGVNGHMGTSGHYNRQVYTGAAELLLAYHTGYKIKYYGYVGAGYTLASATFNFNSNIPHQEFFYGTTHSMFPNNNTTVDLSHFNGQITPFGIRSGGNFAFFFEVGFGYKGMVSGGICYRIGKPYPTTAALNKEAVKGFAIIPPVYTIDNSFTERGEIRTEPPAHRDAYLFSNRLKEFTDAAKKRNSNAILIRELLPCNRHNNFDMAGEAYYVADVGALNAKIEADRNGVFRSENCAYLIIYYPRSFKKSAGISLTINDTNHLFVDPGTKCFLKIRNEGRVKVAAKWDKVRFDAKFGNYYYVSLDNTGKEDGLEVIDSIQGIIESGLIPKSYEYDLETRHILSESPDPHMPAPVSINKLVQNDLVFIPGNYPIDTAWEYLGVLRTGRWEKSKNLSTAQQLKNISDRAMKDSANVIRIMQVKSANGVDIYTLAAKLWKARDPGAVKKAVDKEFHDNYKASYAYVVIYRTDIARGPIKPRKCTVAINDSDEVIVPENTKCIIRLPFEGNMKVSVSKNEVIHLKTQKGSVSYLRVRISHKGNTIEEIDSSYGEIESSTLANVNAINL
jgi:hypothetical protein